MGDYDTAGRDTWEDEQQKTRQYEAANSDKGNLQALKH